MTEPDVIEADAVDIVDHHSEHQDRGMDLVPAEQQSARLFPTEDPAEIMRLAGQRATVLSDVLKTQGMTTDLGGKKPHVNIEGWQTLGTMSGVFAVHPRITVLPWPDPMPDPDALTHPKDKQLAVALSQARAKGLVYGYEASYDAVRNGSLVGGGEATCNRAEKGRQFVDDHALKGMAQTRAQARALSGPLRFIVAMAGYSATPAEEMPPSDTPEPAPTGPPFGDALPPEHNKRVGQAIYTLINDPMKDAEPDVGAVVTQIVADAGGYFPKIVGRAILRLELALLAPLPDDQEPGEGA